MKRAKSCWWLFVLFLILVSFMLSCTGETLPNIITVKSKEPIRTASVVTHPTEKFYDCLRCHNSGREEAAPADHVEYKNDKCLTCHASE